MNLKSINNTVLTLIIFLSLSYSITAKTVKTIKHYPTDSKPLPYALDLAKITIHDNIYIRIFKKEAILQLFVNDSNTYQLLKVYPICRYSGELGPKKKQGDQQAPEGYYYIMKHHLNPNSKFYRSINIGYPNEFDKGHNYTGSAIMIHGGCKSIGCFAMTDSLMKEIYFIVENVLKSHKVIPVHIFPFYMSDDNVIKFNNVKEDNEIRNAINSLLDNEIGLKYEDNFEFWKMLKEGFDYFENNKKPPKIIVINNRYVIQK